MKNLVKKLMAPFALCATILAGAGCATTTTSPWQPSGTTTTQIGSPKISERNVGTKIKKERRLEIAEPVLKEKQYEVKVTESAKEFNYNLIESARETTFRDTDFESRTITTDISGDGVLAFTLMGTGMGVVTPLVQKNAEMIILTLPVGTVLGYLGGCVYAASIPKKSVTEKVALSNSLRIEKEIRGTQEQLNYKKVVYAGRNAEGIPVLINGRNSFTTNEQGILVIPEDSPYFFTKESLFNEMQTYSLMQQIKPEIKARLEKMVLDRIPQSSANYILETKETAFDADEELINATKKFTIPVYGLSDEVIYSAVKQFVQEEINSKIKLINFSAKGSSTHFPIKDSLFRFMSFAPAKSELAGGYFIGNLQRYAENQIGSYLIGSYSAPCPKTLSVPIYCPSVLEIEVVHPDYDYVKDKLTIESGNDVNAEMAEKGQRIKVETFTENSGWIKQN